MIKCPDCGSEEVKVIRYKYDRPMRCVSCAKCKKVLFNGEELE